MEKVNSTRPAQSVGPRLGLKKMMTMKNNTLDMFYGFWKYLGLTAIFLVGIVFFWWGIKIMMNDWGTIVNSMGPIGNLILMPIAMGILLTAYSLSEFLRVIKE